MKRRDPTRIELKLDDIQEYEQMKRDLEAKKNEETEAPAGVEDPSPGRRRSSRVLKKIPERFLKYSGLKFW